MARNTDPFEWSGNHTALDFVNTLDERPSDAPVENCATYADLVRFAELAGLIESSLSKRLQLLKAASCARIARRARALREHLFAVLAAAHQGKPAPAASLEAISMEVRQAHAARTLAATQPSTAMAYRWRSPSSQKLPLYSCALAVEALLVGPELRRIRKCGASDCDVYFLDTSKANRRQWCQMSNCGNREKQRRRRKITR